MASARRGPRAASVMAEPFPEPADDAPFAVGGVGGFGERLRHDGRRAGTASGAGQPLPRGESARKRGGSTLRAPGVCRGAPTLVALSLIHI